ncbi:hypothetical protein SUGI_1166840 [Cryptomeria japonica]|uniref:histone chaperone RTT106 n=1 Tax=Cryptomeria japonica TaxID=3369 RepID=UPI002414942B|nr:histone chaperone RTT106 [Cryptomeria japonica]GLJ54353.1 hypothetical protein SUGI_1166840 [Cryptomeria japonica]
MAFRASNRPRARKPIVPSEDPKAVFVVIRQTESEGGTSRVSVRGVHPTEEQAYSAAIADFIYGLEQEDRSMLPKVREIGKTKTLSLKDRLKSVQSCQDPTGERVEFVVKKSLAFHELKELGSEEFLSEPLMPCSYWDSSDEENYDPEEDEEEDDDDEDEEDEDEDMADLVNEEEALQGIEGSGSKHDDEGKKD